MSPEVTPIDIIYTMTLSLYIDQMIVVSDFL